jgi:hypothetical protein
MVVRNEVLPAHCKTPSSNPGPSDTKTRENRAIDRRWYTPAEAMCQSATSTSHEEAAPGPMAVTGVTMTRYSPDFFGRKT